ncbi:MAG: chemotaxis protein CheC [Methanomicrobiales archaeon HGW-Methanomicrobiales-4]|nr:MAG: chemotaxis protein CheC [Methanomicrobiales archaeon HGW-Methanomicrobiales-4]
MTSVPEPVLDGIKELVNIGIGRSAGSLNSLTGHHITLHVPDVKILRIEELNEQIPHPGRSFSVVNQDYSGAFVGTTVLMFPEKSAEGLFQLLTGEERRTQENDELWQMTLLEVGNIIGNAVMGSITNILGNKLEFHLPEYREDSLDHIFSSSRFTESKYVIIAHAEFSVKEQNIQGEILLILADQSIDVLATSINEKMGI